MAGRYHGGRKRGDSPTRMTEFAPLSSDARPAGGFFSRLFKRKGSLQVEGVEESGSSQESSRETSREPSRNPSREATPTHSDIVANDHRNQDEGGVSQWVDHDMVVVETDDIPSDSEGAGPGGVGHSRTLSSVLKRLSTILDRRSQTPQAYKDSDFRQYWMPDSDCKECYECSDKFNTFRRRHHCRICGQIFCSRCCNQEVPGKIMGYTGYLRVCTYCCKVVLSYAQHQEATTDLRALSEDLRHLSTVDEASGSTSYQEFGWLTHTTKRKGSKTSRVSSIFSEDKQRSSSSPELHSPTSSMNPFDVTPLSEYSSVDNFQQERRILTQDSVQLRELWVLMQHQVDGIEMQSHRHRLRTHPNCVVGSELVDWLITRDKAANRVQAVAIGQALVDAKWLECVTSADQIFRDEYSLYRPGEATMREDVPELAVSVDTSGLADDDDNEPSWFREIRRTDEDIVSVSEYHNIPPTVSGGDMSDGAGTSVFYVDSAEPPPKPKKLKTSLSTTSSERGTSVLKLTDLLAGSPWEGEFEPNQNETRVQGHGEGSQDMMLPQDNTAGMADELFKGAFAVNNEAVPLEIDIPEGWQSSEHLREENGERLSFERLGKANREHLKALTSQLLTREGLSLKWSETVLSVTRKIAQVVRPDVRHEADDMDIRQYIQIKKIPGGSRSNTSIVCGVVCTKNVTHKKMRQHIVNPKILLLRAPIEYQRVENKYSSLEPQILQEDQFLKNCVGRIAALEPDILLVEKSASRVAQEFLLDASITLVLNVKPSVMERVARFTQGDVISSIDGLVSKSALGFCHTFRLQTFMLPNGSSKTLMYFDGCASHLGCTVTLRGGSAAELRKVKQILHFVTYAAYHAKLETSFLMDEFALPPPAPDEKEFSISGFGTSPTTPDGAMPVVDDLTKSRSGSVEVAEEAVPGVVAPKGVIAMFEDSFNQSETVEDDIECATDKVRGLGQESSNIPVVTNQKEEREEKVDNVVEVTSHCKKREGSEVESPQRLQKRYSRDYSTLSEVVQDFSDPLQNYQKSKDESIFHSVVDLKEEVLGNKHHFKKALDDVILSTSPYLKYDVPYLMTDAGKKCVLRKYFPKDIYWSRAFENDHNKKPRFKFSESEEDKLPREQRGWLKLDRPHPFVTEKITAPLQDPSTQSLLADFRARGGRIQHPIGGLGQIGSEKSRAELEERGLSLSTSWDRRTDCLDPTHHQRIAVLFSSFSYVSNNTPNPCVNPWIVSMDFYGRNDITLGGFLERYCFRETYTCPSESCDTPMVDHIRRFVHESGCIQIVLKQLDSPIHGYQNNVLMWGWCRRCKQVTPVAPMSLDTWSMSFAKYLELRFHGNVYTRRAGAELCSHPLHHDHYQYFGSHQIVASFKYVPILLREVALPPIIVTLKDSAVCLATLAEDAKTLSFKGTSVYSSILEHLHRLKRDAQTEAQAILLSEYIAQLQDNKDVFRECMDEIQLKLSVCVPASQGHLDNLQVINSISVLAPVAHDILDSIVEVKRQIADAVTNWNNRIQDFEQQQRKLEKSRISQNSRGSRDHLNTPDSAPSVEGSTNPRWFQKEEPVDMETEPTFVVGSGETRSSTLGTSLQEQDIESGWCHKFLYQLSR